MLDLNGRGGAQHIEMRTRQWRAPVFREVAEGIAGRQVSAYLQILWHDTWLADRAVAVGMNVGLVVLVREDIRSGDPRYTTLPKADKREVLAWAMKAMQALRKENLRCLDALLQTIEPILKETS